MWGGEVWLPLYAATDSFSVLFDVERFCYEMEGCVNARASTVSQAYDPVPVANIFHGGVPTDHIYNHPKSSTRPIWVARFLYQHYWR
eukprot:COSAG02_NODE_7041_length_3214_cov_1.509470_3_plen_87_part_00